TTPVILGALFAAAIAANIVWAIVAIRKSEAKKEEKHGAPSRLSHDAAGNAVLTVDKETQARVALGVQPLEEAALPNETVAYGRFLEDPARSLTVRSPITGVLRRTTDRDWPALGQSLEDGTAIGLVDPRFAPLDRVDLQSKLSAARADVEAGKSSLETSKAA